MKVIVNCRNVSLLAWFAVAIMLSPCPASAAPLYSLGGHVHTNVPVIGGVYRVTNPDVPRTSLSDTSTMIGTADNEATAEYQGNLATGTLQARVYATRTWDEGSWVPAMAATSVYFFDKLLFTVPAGSYPMGLCAEATGSVKGSIGKSGAGTAARVQYQAWFGSYASQHYNDIDLGPTDPDQVVNVDETFVLNTKLVNPGTVLNDPIVVHKEIFAGLGNSSVLGASTWGGEPGAAWAETDFFDTLAFRSITAPSGVTWSSASATFLTPVPSPLLLLGSGLATIIGLRRKRIFKKA